MTVEKYVENWKRSQTCNTLRNYNKQDFGGVNLEL